MLRQQRFPLARRGPQVQPYVARASAVGRPLLPPRPATAAPAQQSTADAPTVTATAAIQHAAPRESTDLVLQQHTAHSAATHVSGTTYLATRLSKEVLLVVAGVLLIYRLVLVLVNRSAQKYARLIDEYEREQSAIDVAAASADATESDSESSPLAAAPDAPAATPGGGEGAQYDPRWSPMYSLMSNMASAMKGPTATFLVAALSVHSLRQVSAIVDAWLHAYKPYVEYNVLHFLCESLVPLDKFMGHLLLGGIQVYACVAFLIVKHELVKRMVTPDASKQDVMQMEALRAARAVSGTLTAVAIALTFTSIAGLLGVNLKPLLAVGGAGSIVLGLASQQVLSNFAAGLTFLWDRPFVPGEHVTLSSGVRGKVKLVRMMRTVIRSDDGALVSVPNQALASMVITNRSYGVHGSSHGPGPLLPSLDWLRFAVRLPVGVTAEKLVQIEADLKAALVLSGLPGCTSPAPRSSATSAPHVPLVLRLVAFSKEGISAVATVNLDVKQSKRARPEQVQAAMLHLTEALAKHQGTLSTM